MDLLIHATLTVTGDPALLPAVDARIKALLVEEVFAGEFEEHHGADALAYDFKVQGGIPFPAFAAASQEFPALEISAEWVNVAAGRKGRARLGKGSILEHVEELMAGHGADVPNRYLRADADGTLRLAFALLRRGPQEWAGYVLNHERDAWFSLRRDGDVLELLATEGDAAWVWRWQCRFGEAAAGAEACVPPQPVDAALSVELERLAEDYVAGWFWLREAPAADNAIEIDRYARYGYVVRDANVRAAQLHRLRANLNAGQPLEYSTLDAECDWIRELLQRCWATGQ